MSVNEESMMESKYVLVYLVAGVNDEYVSLEACPLSVTPAKHLSGLTVGGCLHNWTLRLETPHVSVHLILKPVRLHRCDGYENLTAPINPRFITVLQRSRMYFPLTLTWDWLNSPTRRVCCLQTKTKVSINQKKIQLGSDFMWPVWEGAQAQACL